MTDTTVHLDDLAEPRFTAEADQLRDMIASLAPDCPLDSDALHAKAIADTGLDDFGADDYRERLEVYLADVRDVDGLTGVGVVNFYGQLLQVLKNRLLLTDLLSRHPRSTTSSWNHPSSSWASPARGRHICTTCWELALPSGRCRIGKAWNPFRWRRRPA